MNAFDGVAIFLAAWTAWAGYRQGFAHRVLTWVGFLLGLWAASIVVESWFDFDGATSMTTTQFLKVLAVLLIGATLGQVLGALAGRHLSRLVTAGGLGPLDAAGGVVVGLVGIVLSVWVIAPAMADVPGWPARQSRNSFVARSVVDLLGDPPSVLGDLSESMGIPGGPDVFDSLRGAPDVPTPPNSPVPDSVWRSASNSVLRITGTACDRFVSGSGWIVGPELVVTNAHVVAGTESVEVQAQDGERWSGRVVAFDARNDLAVLRIRGLDRQPLEIDPPTRGDVGVVLGFPGGGPLKVEPYVVGDSLDAKGEDIYGVEGVLRRIIVVGSQVQPGDSGGPLIDPDGDVAGVVFAVAPDRDGVAYAVRTSEVTRLLRGELQKSVDVGPCV